MTIQQANQTVVQRLRSLYDAREAAAVAELLMEKITGQRKIDRIVDPHAELSPRNTKLLHDYLDALDRGAPVQYVIREAWFMGMKLFVDSRVLIPRPETEELVQWILDDHRHRAPLNVLDIGTGSGCIAIALHKKLTGAFTTAVDTSADAIDVARANAAILNVAVAFVNIDILDSLQSESLPSFDIVVSNPPYIPESERPSLPRNVAEQEPGLALFVPDDDPLVFYRAIAAFGNKNLNRNGSIYVEVHEARAQETAAIFEDENYVVDIRRDMQEKPRMIRARKNPVT